MNLPDAPDPFLLKIIALLIALALTTAAADFTPDPTFNPPFSQDTTIHTVLPLKNGATLVGGNFSTSAGENLLLLNNSGLPDRAFSAAVQGTVLAAAQDSASRLVIGGAFNAVNGAPMANLARLLPTGELDPTFTPPQANGRIRDVEILPDDALLLAGDFTRVGPATAPYIARLTSNGSYDPNFQIPLQLSFAIEAGACRLALQSDGKILVGGVFDAESTPAQFLRLNADGTLDATFSNNHGPIIYLEDIQTAPDGAIYICGTATYTGGGFLRKLSANGAVDPSFSEVAADGCIKTISFDQYDGILFGGDFSLVNGESRSNLARLLENGALEPDFDFPTDGPVESVRITASSVYIGGYFSTIGELSVNSIARLNAPGFQSTGTVSRTTFKSYLAGTAGKTYLVETSTNLVDWFTFGTATATANGIEVVDGELTQNARRFFRARLLQ
jgi:uncharacterized delta-60 repeat protein